MAVGDPDLGVVREESARAGGRLTEVRRPRDGEPAAGRRPGGRRTRARQGHREGRRQGEGRGEGRRDGRSASGRALRATDPVGSDPFDHLVRDRVHRVLGQEGGLDIARGDVSRGGRVLIAPREQPDPSAGLEPLDHVGAAAVPLGQAPRAHEAEPPRVPDLGAVPRAVLDHAAPQGDLADHAAGERPEPAEGLGRRGGVDAAAATPLRRRASAL